MLPGGKREPYGLKGTGAQGRQFGGWVSVVPAGGGGTPQRGHSDFLRGSALPSIFNMQFLTAALKALEPRIDDDFVDRLNYYYTTSIMVMFAILVSAKQYVGHPIECWVPAQFTKAMEQYTENYCWIQNTYWVPFGDLIPSRMGDRERRQIGYYQWVPFILALEALLFYIPATMWRLLNSQSGINILGILQLAADERNIEPENRMNTVNILSRHINDVLRYQRDFGSKDKSVYIWAFIKVGKFFGAYCTLLYCLVKSLYLTNVVGQFILLNRFLETNEYPFFGAHIVWDLLHGTEWRNSGKFPRVTLCDFDIRVLGNIHRHTVQCVLVINMFTEKIFIFLWLWFLMLTIVTAGNLLFYAVTLLVPNLRVNFVQKYLSLATEPLDFGKDKKHLRRFVMHFLRPDGVFILKMISTQTGTILCTELMQSLWMTYRESVKPPKLSEADIYSMEPKKSLTEKVLEHTLEESALMSGSHRSSKESDEPHWIKPPPLPLGNHKSVLLGPNRGKFVPEKSSKNGKSRSQTPMKAASEEVEDDESVHRMHL